MKLTKEEVKHIAMLSRLTFSEEEIEKFREQLSKILDFVERLNELDTEGIDPKFQLVPPGDTLREDVVSKSLEREEVLKNAPQTDGRYFIVPKVVKK